MGLWRAKWESRAPRAQAHSNGNGPILHPARGDPLFTKSLAFIGPATITILEFDPTTISISEFRLLQSSSVPYKIVSLQPFHIRSFHCSHTQWSSSVICYNHFFLLRPQPCYCCHCFLTAIDCSPIILWYRTLLHSYYSPTLL